MRKIQLLLFIITSLFADVNFYNFYPDKNSINFLTHLDKYFTKSDAVLGNEKFKVYTKLPEIKIEPKNTSKTYDTTQKINQYNAKINIKTTILNKNNSKYEKTNEINTFKTDLLLDYDNLLEFKMKARDFNEKLKLKRDKIYLIEIELLNIYNSTNKMMFSADLNIKSSFIVDDVADEKAMVFGSIWKIKKPNLHDEKIPQFKDLDNALAVVKNEAYTRVVGSDVFLALIHKENKNNIRFYSNTDKVEKDNNIIIYKRCDFNGCLRDYVVNPDGILMGDYIIGFINTTVGRHDICFEEIQDGKVINNVCREFSIRPAYISTTTAKAIKEEDSTEIEKTSKHIKTHKKTAGKDLKSLNNNDEIITNFHNSDDYLFVPRFNFAIKEANLMVANSKNKIYNFSLENKNSQKITHTNPALISNDGSGFKMNLKISYPFSSKGVINFKENDFVGSDITANRCRANEYLTADFTSEDLAAKIDELNTIDADGKIACNIPIMPIKIEFDSEDDFMIKNISTNNNLSDAVLFSDEVLGQNKVDLNKCSGLNCDFDEALRLPINIFSKGDNSANSLKFVYKHYKQDKSINFDFKFIDNFDDAASKRYRIYTDKLIKDSINITNQEINMSLIATKDELNKLYDLKLEQLNQSVNIKNQTLSSVAKDYEAKEDELEFITKLGYTKFYESLDYAPSAKLLPRAKVREFSLNKDSFVQMDSKTQTINNDYSFIFAYAAFKDLKALLNAKSVNVGASDIDLFYLNKAGNPSKLHNNINALEHYYLRALGDIMGDFEYASDYNSLINKISSTQIQIELNPNKQNNEYVKDIIRAYSKGVVSTNSTFSVEFKSNLGRKRSKK